MKREIHFLWLLIVVFCSCKSARINRQITKNLNTSFYSDQFTGVMVYDPQTHDTVIKYNANKYFIPASNTKIITLYTALQILPEQIPAFKYSIEKDSITILGTGNPIFLHSFFNDSTALKIAEDYKKVNVVINNLADEKLGPGWAWEDYDTYFSPERNSFPMYGNVLTITNNDSLQCAPKILKNKIQYLKTNHARSLNENKFFYVLKQKDTLKIPMVMDSLLIKKLWDALLPNKVSVSIFSGKKMDHIAYSSIRSDSLYKRMMLESDNFLAEQILILASSTLSDTLSSGKIREIMLNSQLKDLKQKPKWVDGSGLSRYNLFTPTSFVQVLTKLYNEIPRKRLFNLFPVGGKSGTLKKYYAGITKPYIYAKSGTVENNYSLSGYLVTNSGKTLIFSFMNNHYKKSTLEIKKRMESVFEYLRDNY